jgi:GTPase SAR1 family protein
LEKPTLAAPYLHYEEVNYKVLLVGKGSCGKTSFIETICSPKTYISSLRSDADDINDSGNHFYPETPGIQITHVYWPVKMANFEKFLMFDLAMWDVGKQAITKYDYIIPVSLFSNSFSH